MLKSAEFFKEDNDKVIESYKRGLSIIKEICLETDNCEECGQIANFYNYLNYTGKFILKLADIEKKYNDEYFKIKSFDELKKENYELYKELIDGNYSLSYANPVYAVSVLGDGFGQLLSAFYTRIRQGISYSYQHRIFNLEENNTIFIELFYHIKHDEINYEDIKSIINRPFFDQESLTRNLAYSYGLARNAEYGFYLNPILESDFNDLRYLFKLDKYITENEIKTAEFLLKYPKDKIETLSKATVDAYIRGFLVENKKRGQRNVVRIYYFAGQEIIIRQLIKDFQAKGFKCSIGVVDSTIPNKQFDYDHRFDRALYVNEAYTKLREEAFETAASFCEDEFKFSAGPMVFESFGEKPYSPEKKNECLKLTKDQEELWQRHTIKIDEIFNKFVKNEETSFSIIAFPSPEIGEKFKDIFEDTLKINMMDNTLYEGIQQAIIDALDKGEYVHIMGKDGNETDIKVKLPELKNPEKETNFVNCVADVNIPLGEVYTTPELKGTNGLLHLKDIYLDIKYKDLKLTFEDGYVVDYNCANFDNENDNKEYVKENLMETHDRLPLGEFAIGTNTHAYVMAQKYNIIELLPILIIEKMGPHFAIGDTCFGWSEDLPVYNILNKKEIVARDNEKSILRKEDISKAYTGVHTDITIPYEEIGAISVISKDGENIDIIRDGRFVLKGTEELNKAFQ